MTVEPDDLNPTDRLCLRVLREGRATAAYIADVGGYSTGNVRTRLKHLEEHDHLAKIHSGLYQLTDDPLAGEEIDVGEEAEERLAADRVDGVTALSSAGAGESSRDAAEAFEEAFEGEDVGTTTPTESEPATTSAPSATGGEATATIATVVEDVADGWADPDDRLAARKAAARAVLQHALDTGEAVGKSEAIEGFNDDYPVQGQSPETWYRKNIRPVLQEAGEYSNGAHGYIVTELDD